MKQIIAFVIFFTIPILACADSLDESQACEIHKAREYKPGMTPHVICLYEPNTVGLTWDNDDHERFMDFKLSVRYQLAPEWSTDGLNWVSNHLENLMPMRSKLGDNSAIYFAFSGRFGQYIGNRDSSPVIGKRFNPKIFIRFWGDKGKDDTDHRNSNYMDISLYNHESNGQAINSKTGYDQAVSQAIAKGDRSTDANDLISRSWNIVDINYRRRKIQTIDDVVSNKYYNIETSGYFGVKYFIPSKTEEFNPLGGTNPQGLPGWETDPEGKPRQQVDGLSAALKGKVYKGDDDQSHYKYYLGYTTGIRNPGRYKTWRAELTGVLPWLDIPITLYKQIGYNNELAQYYKKVSTVGFYVDIGSF